MITTDVPISLNYHNECTVGDKLSITGYIFTGRDAVLPKVVRLIKDNRLDEYGINLQGSVIFHTAVSPAGIGPTSSNKYDIESTIPELSKAGVKLHIGKGALSKETIKSLEMYRSMYAIIPPVTALLNSKIKEKKVFAFPEEGMEALHLIKVEQLEVIIAAVNGKSLF